MPLLISADGGKIKMEQLLMKVGNNKGNSS
jgi:hypothetical protein